MSFLQQLTTVTQMQTVIPQDVVHIC